MSLDAESTVRLRPISPEAAAAVRVGRPPPDAHTPLDRPASARVAAKAGLRPVGEVDDEHDGVPIRVIRWELILIAPADSPAGAGSRRRDPGRGRGTR